MTTDYRALASSYATQVGISPTIFVAQIQQESGFNPNAVSSAGAIGIAQFMPQTAQGLGLNPHDPVASLKAAAQYDARNLKLYNGDYSKMLAAYNAGGGTVNSASHKGGSNWLSLMPTETQNYVKSILKGTTPEASSSTSTSTARNVLSNFGVWGEYAALFLIALLLIIVGFMLLSGKDIVTRAKKAVIP